MQWMTASSLKLSFLGFPNVCLPAFPPSSAAPASQSFFVGSSLSSNSFMMDHPDLCTFFCAYNHTLGHLTLGPVTPTFIYSPRILPWTLESYTQLLTWCLLWLFDNMPNSTYPHSILQLLRLESLVIFDSSLLSHATSKHQHIPLILLFKKFPESNLFAGCPSSCFFPLPRSTFLLSTK